jgi:hypothetical protein
MAADFSAEWTRDLGDGRLLVMDRGAVGYRALLMEFRGVGSTQEAALDDLLASMRHYCEAADDLKRDLAPGGQLHEKLQQIRQLVDQCVAEDQRGR